MTALAPPIRLRLAAGAPLCGATAVAGVAAAVAVTRLTSGTDHSPISPADPSLRALWIGGLALALIAYLGAIFLSRRLPVPLVPVLVTALAIQAAPLASPLLFSHDAHVYWDYGRLAAVHHANPFTVQPNAFPGDPAYPLMGANWHETTSAYGPLWIGVAAAHASVVGTSARAAALGYKLIAFLGVLVLVGAAVALARNRAGAAVFLGWNPLLALHFSGGGHNDAWMMAFTLLGIQALRRGSRASGLAWAAAVAVKWLPLIFLPQIAAARRLRLPWRDLAVGFAVAALVSTLAFRLGWLEAVLPIKSQLGRASSTSIPDWVARTAGVPVRPVTLGFTAAFAAAYCLLLRHAWRTGRARLALTAGLLLLSVSWLTPWYATWPLALAAVEEDDGLGRGLALALTAYLLRDAVQL
ncbi:MAG TPA: hypothetical protein VFI37_01195 [Gaiellaceae bacterium]|nr:hypothetical protein [Gaiellaceae bacterium]